MSKSIKVRCRGCGTGTIVDASSPLCSKCWGRVPDEARAEYLDVEALHHRKPDADRLALAREFIEREARLTYRLDILRKLWRTSWRKKFKAKFGLEHQIDRAASEPNPEIDSEADPTTLENPTLIDLL